MEDITLNKLSCRFHTAAHPQSDCEAVGVLDLNSNEPRVDMSLRNLKVLQGGDGGWSCTGPPARLVAPPVGVVYVAPEPGRPSVACCGAAVPLGQYHCSGGAGRPAAHFWVVAEVLPVGQK